MKSTLTRATLSVGVVMLGAFILLLTSVPRIAHGQEQTGISQFPGARKSIDTLKQEFFHVSAGKRLRPKSWPNGARAAVGLSFDVDNASALLGRGDLRLEGLTRGEYGAVDGLPRVLRVLDARNVPASFFIPAVSAELHPQMVKDIQASGRHEVAVHGWIHELLPLLDNEQEEQRMLDQAIASLTRMSGKRPVGYRAPSWQFSQFTMKQVKAAGFLYDSSLMSSDDAYEILMDGQPSGVVELPIEWIRDDFPLFGATNNGSLPSPDLVLQAFQAEFDAAYDEGGVFILTMHPHIIGHRARAAVLDRLIQHMQAKPGVWFGTHEAIAKWVKEHGE